MSINDLKVECNSLIDEAMRLQKKEHQLDLQIEKLEEQIQFLINNMLEKDEVDKQEVAEANPLCSDDKQGECEPPEIVFPEKLEQYPEEQIRPILKIEDQMILDQQLEEEKTPPDNAMEKVESVLPAEKKNISLKEEAPRLPAAEEEQLMRQVSLLAGENNKDIVIVYEASAAAQRLKDIMKSIFLLIVMLLLIAAAALLLYYAFTKGVVRENVF
uniref:hypothetical protein n=1 Tax=Acetatifactor sp. TaxID=1872090 RepID=UPI004055F260